MFVTVRRSLVCQAVWLNPSFYLVTYRKPINWHLQYFLFREQLVYDQLYLVNPMFMESQFSLFKYNKQIKFVRLD